MTGVLIERAYAKLNLGLHVRRRRDDGYHEIETLFAFCETGDALGIDEGDELSLTIHGKLGEGLSTGPDNLVLRAAAALRDAAGIKRGARLVLFKDLPVASGIGGGSADAAATLRLLWHYWRLGWSEEQLCEVAAPLGADVPACVRSRTLIGRGRGDELETAVSGFEGRPVLLVNPLEAVPTGRVFAKWDGTDRGPLDPADPARWRNDLTGPAIEIAPAIGDMLDRLEAQRDALMVRMSGSGATCFAIFVNEGARDSAALAFPDCWTLATRLRNR